jgi:hypothetical protein
VDLRQLTLILERTVFVMSTHVNGMMMVAVNMTSVEVPMVADVASVEVSQVAQTDEEVTQDVLALSPHAPRVHLISLNVQLLVDREMHPTNAVGYQVDPKCQGILQTHSYSRLLVDVCRCSLFPTNSQC